MRRLYTLLVLLSWMALAAVAVASPGQIGGTWRATVLKQGEERTVLEDYELLLTFDVHQGTWSAYTKRKGQEQTTEGTFTVDDAYLILETREGTTHPLRATVQNDQLVLSPKDQPALRLVALRVK